MLGINKCDTSWNSKTVHVVGCCVNLCMYYCIRPLFLWDSVGQFSRGTHHTYMTYDGKYERIDQYSDFFHVEQQNRNSSTYTSLQHPTTVLLSHMYHICTQQLFNFQKIIFSLIPSPSRGLPPVFSSTFDSTSTTLLTWERVV